MITIENPKSTPATQGPIQWIPGYDVKAKMKRAIGRMLWPH